MMCFNVFAIELLAYEVVELLNNVEWIFPWLKTLPTTDTLYFNFHVFGNPNLWKC